MKCRCPACGRSTEVDAAGLDFFARCLRCGVLLKPRVQSGELEEEKESLVAKVVFVGRVREGHGVGGEITELLCRPVAARGRIGAGVAVATREEKEEVKEEGPELYELAPAGPPTGGRVLLERVVEMPESVPAKMRRRVALRERHETLGMVGLFGLGMIALMAVGAIAIKSRNIFIRPVRAGTVDQVRVGGK